MNCQSMSPLISRLLDRELHGSEQALLEDHLCSCRTCDSTLESWRRDGSVLRGFFDRHALGEDFVRKVGSSRAGVMSKGRLVESDAEGTRALPGFWSSWGFQGWLKVAAAALVVVFVAMQWFVPKTSLSLAQLVHTEDGVEVRRATSQSWINATAGARLWNGDWIRNRDHAPARIQISDRAEVSLERNAMLRLAVDQDSNEVALYRGGVQSKTYGRDEPIEILTSTGRIIGSEAQFRVRVQKLVLPTVTQIHGRELVQGESLEITDVAVEEGMVSIATSHEMSPVQAGSRAFMTPSGLASVAGSEEQKSRIRADLSVEAKVGPGEMSSQLITDEHGTKIRVNIKSIPLSTLVEWTTGHRFLTEDVPLVNGELEYAPGTSPTSVIAAVADNLGLRIITRRQVFRAETVSLKDQSFLGIETESSRFSIERSAAGEISFEFLNTRAIEVFESLRRYEIVLPYLSDRSRDAVISLRAVGLRSDQIWSWLDNELVFERYEAEQSVEVAELDVNLAGDLLQETLLRPPSGLDPNQCCTSGTPDDMTSPKSEPSEDLSPQRRRPRRSSVPERSAVWRDPISIRRSLWNILDMRPESSNSPSAEAPDLVSDHSAEMEVGGDLIDPGEESEVGSDERIGTWRLIWPVIPNVDTRLEYEIHNPAESPMATQWRLYDSMGSLIFEAVIEVDGRPQQRVSPLGFSENLVPAGSHWETVSDEFLRGRGAKQAGSRPGSLSEPEGARESWEFRPEQQPIQLWVVNANVFATEIVITVLLDGEATIVDYRAVGSHAGIVWAPKESIDWDHSSARVVIQAMEGVVAAGFFEETRTD